MTEPKVGYTHMYRYFNCEVHLHPKHAKSRWVLGHALQKLALLRLNLRAFLVIYTTDVTKFSQLVAKYIYIAS